MTRHLIVTSNTPPIDYVVHEAIGVARIDATAEFRVVVTANPVSHGFVWTEGESRAVAERMARELRDRLARAGLQVTSASAGDASAIESIGDARRAGERFDGLIVAADANGLTRRLKLDVWSRAARLFDVPVTAVATSGAFARAKRARRLAMRPAHQIS